MGLSATDAYGRALVGDASNVSDVIEFEAKSSQGFKNKGPPPLPGSLIGIALWGAIRCPRRLPYAKV
jgi:hypothetical protein